MVKWFCLSAVGLSAEISAASAVVGERIGEVPFF